MAIQQFLATVRTDGSLMLPSDAQDNLHLIPGEIVRISLDRVSDFPVAQETEEAFNVAEFFAETDSLPRQPSLPSEHKAEILEEIAEKHRRMGLKIPC